MSALNSALLPNDDRADKKLIGDVLEDLSSVVMKRVEALKEIQVSPAEQIKQLQKDKDAYINKEGLKFHNYIMKKISGIRKRMIMEMETTRRHDYIGDNYNNDSISEETNSVDWRGRPSHPNKHGGMKAAAFVLGVQTFEIMGIATVGNNLITYVINEMHFSLSKSANIVNFIGTLFILALLGGYLSDSYLGCFWTILIFGFVELSLLDSTEAKNSLLSFERTLDEELDSKETKSKEDPPN